MIAVDFSNPFVIVFVIGTILTFILNHFLEYIDFTTRKKNGGHIPDVMKSVQRAAELFDEEKLDKIVRYENAKYFFWIPRSVCSLVLTMCLVIFGFYPWLFGKICLVTGIPSGFWSLFFCYLLFSVISGIPETILDLPFSLYREFSIEKRFGFSNMTLKLWIQDELKSLLVALIPALVLAALISLAFTYFETTWWLIVSVIIIAFVFIIQIVYPKFIAPLFNKFEPLPEGELKDKLCVLLEKTGFKNDGLFIMDESKRSGHSNAYFSGFGRNKRIVLYDTLTKQLSSDELVAVLGHELGHFKLKHITKRLVLMLPLVFVATFILYKFSQISSLYEGFGFHLGDSVGSLGKANGILEIRWIQFIGLTLISFVWEAISEIVTPFGNISSRKQEYQADKFAAEICGTSNDLISGLVKLNAENLSELFPPAIYVWWNFSHPTLVQRIEALKKYEEQKTSERQEKSENKVGTQ